MKATIYNYSKKHNSTKGMPTSGGTEVDIDLKWAGCGITNPVLIINYGLTNPPYNFNYVVIPSWHRGYFVGDWTFDRGMWTAPCICDVMGSYRDNILNKSLFVIRAKSDWNGNIPDLERVGTAAITREWIFKQFDNTTNPANGTFIVGVSGKTSRKTMGCVQYYSLNQEQMFELCTNLLQNTNWLDIDWETAGEYITNDLVKCLLNPLQYIVSCHWIPWEPTGLDTQSGQLPVGWWSVPVNNAKVVPAGKLVSKSYTIDINHHPKESVAPWAQSSPYTQYNLFVPLVGNIVIDPVDIVGYNRLIIQYTLDAVTGDAIVNVLTQENAAVPYSKLLRSFNVNMSVKIPLSQMTSDVYSAGMSVFNGVVDISKTTVGAVGQALSQGGKSGFGAGNIVDAVSSITLDNAKTFVNTVGDFVTSMIPKVETIGTVGSWARYLMDSQIILECIFMDITDIDLDTMGAPLCEKRQLSSLSGYAICKTGDIDIDAMYGEYQMIEHYLTTGFYIE